MQKLPSSPSTSETLTSLAQKESRKRISPLLGTFPRRFVDAGGVVMDSGCGCTLGGRGRGLAVGGCVDEHAITHFTQPSL